MPNFNRRTFNARIHFTPPKVLDTVEAGARLLLDPDIMEGILRQAMAETLLLAYKRKFLKGLPGAVNMHVLDARHSADRKIPLRTQIQLINAYAALSRARAAGKPRAIKEATDSISALRTEIHKQLERRTLVSKHRLPHGEFRHLALRILDIMADPSEIQKVSTSQGLTLAIGNIAKLDQIETPSATPELTGHETSSTKKILWRHLEFGTGAYAVGPEQERAASGGWWYGRAPGDGLALKGSRPIKALGDPARRLPHDPDSQRFQKVFAQLVAAALAGKGGD